MSGAAAEYRLLAVDDDEDLLEAIARRVSRRGFEIEKFSRPGEALAAIESGRQYDIALSDVHMPEMSGIQLLERLKEMRPDLPVVMLTADSEVSSAVEAMRIGAANYLSKPIRDFDAFAAVLRAAASYSQLGRKVADLQARLDRAEKMGAMVGRSPAMVEVFTAIERTAPLDVSVLITGESGTGKELVARELHKRSSRSEGPFVALNCAALPEGLIDSELFGHERGAFTGAHESRAGIFERARGGTVFLDEIGDIPMAVQVRLLRALQEREIIRVGGSKSISVDMRLISATLVDLEDSIADGEFRQDLFFRLNVVHLELPPLRRRDDDLQLLVVHLLEKHANRLGRSVPQLTEAAWNVLSSYAWPGNVRELENALQGAMALSSGDVIDADGLPKRIRRGPKAEDVDSLGPASIEWADGMPLSDARKMATARFEREYVARLLDKTDGNITRAAEEAGMDRTNFRRVMKRCGVYPKERS